MLLDELDTTIAAVQSWVADLDHQVLDGADAGLLVERFAKLERLGAAGRALAARRVADTNAWKPDGSRSAADWVAGKTKTSPAQASASLDTTERLEDLPATKEAFTTGEITEAQAAEISSAAHADPGAEQGLLDTAKNSSMSALRRAARAVRAAASRSQLKDRDRVHRSRYLRHWTTGDGAFEAHCRLTADQGALLLSALDAEHRLIFDQARSEGRHESSEAYRADALVNLARNTLAGFIPGAPGGDFESDPPPTAPCGPTTSTEEPGTSGGDPGTCDGTCSTGDGTLFADGDRSFLAGTWLGSEQGDGWDGDEPPDGGPVPPRDASAAPPPASPGGAAPGASGGLAPPPRRARLVPTVTVRVDHTALVRGWTQPGEVCEIVGIGPVPVETARAYARGDAVIRALLVDGERVIDARHVGRTIPARLRMALEERDRTCVVPGCTSARHLEIHHLDAFALGGETSLANTCRVCPYHHDQITYGKAELTGRPGHWTWTQRSPDPDYGPFDDPPEPAAAHL